NSQSDLMPGLLYFYEDFALIIKGGFNSDLAIQGLPTFPMWGYGWVFLITESRFLIFLAQSIVAVLSVYYLVQYLYLSDDFSERMIKHFMFFVLVSFSWIAIHFTLVPNSFAISFKILSIVLLLFGLNNLSVKNSIYYIIVSALFFGLVLNFRPDYIYFTLVILFVIIWFESSKKGVLYATLWLFIVALLLAPWAIYTYSNFDKPLLTSTNSGHVLFIGLGQLPGNKWNITPNDHDPRMWEELGREMGDDVHSLSYDGDQYLKNRFVELVLANPVEYSKKVSYSAIKTLISGIYVPEFYRLRSDCEIDCRDEFLMDIRERPVGALFDDAEKFFLYSITYLSIIGGIILLFLSYIITPFVMIKGLKTKNLLLLLCGLLMIYQLMINSFAFQMKLYSTNTYLFGIVLLAYFTAENKFISNKLSNINLIEK
ncbi:MAG: hypothetical protein WDZ80_07695, partial [Candidatus Paceibacterota bacterium]